MNIEEIANQVVANTPRLARAKQLFVSARPMGGHLEGPWPKEWKVTDGEGCIVVENVSREDAELIASRIMQLFSAAKKAKTITITDAFDYTNPNIRD
jgi:uncharacterized protein with NRDE domain